MKSCAPGVMAMPVSFMNDTNAQTKDGLQIHFKQTISLREFEDFEVFWVAMRSPFW